MTVPDPIETARLLASIYGQRLERPIFYPQAVALSGRLRLAGLDRETPDPSAEIQRIVEPMIREPAKLVDTEYVTAQYGGLCWADELSDATGDLRYAQLLVRVADEFALPARDSQDWVAAPLDPDARVEDFFLAGMVLGRAYRIAREPRYLDIITGLLLGADTQQPDGLWWHARSAPHYWGRGNAFAALGFAETLSYLPETDARREKLLERHLAHLQGLRAHQDASGMWRQVIDHPESYLEHTATSMIGCAITRGLRRGWLEDEWLAVAESAWRGAAERIGPAGQLEHTCVGTGPYPDLQSYLERPYEDGLDDRGGAMALWFAVELARLRDGV